MLYLRPTPADRMTWIQEFGLFVQIQVFQITSSLMEGDTEMQCHYDILKYEPVFCFKFQL